METKNETISGTVERELVITRILNAPRELVFEAWTKPEHLIKWWGPKGFTNTFKEINIKAGGTWLFTMHGPDGTDYPNKIVFKEVVKPERLVYFHSGDDDEPGSFDTTVTFEDLNGKTKLTMIAVFASAEELKEVIEKHGAVEGGKQTIDKLEAHLKIMLAD